MAMAVGAFSLLSVYTFSLIALISTNAHSITTQTKKDVVDVNFTAVLEEEGCSIFASLIQETGVVKVYQKAAEAEKGLTLFAPLDEAFKDPKMPDLSKLTNAELLSLLLYHALARYKPKATLKTTKGAITTLATNFAGNYDITVSSAGDAVTINAGLDSSRISCTVIDTKPLAIFTVDNVLLPVELFGNSTSSAPSPSPAASPPKKANDAGDMKAPAYSKALLTVSTFVMVSFFLS